MVTRLWKRGEGLTMKGQHKGSLVGDKTTLSLEWVVLLTTPLAKLRIVHHKE